MLADVERGVAAGAVGGLAYGAYVAVVANPLVEHLEALAHHEGHGHGDGHGHSHGHSHDHAHAAVSELTTAVVSVGSGVLWGILLGAAFGVAFYLFEPALPGAGATKAVVLAGVGFFTVSAVPWLVLPPAAPGMDQALTTDLRIVLYAALMAVGALTAAVALLTYRRLRPTRGTGASATVALAPILLVGLLLALGTPTVVQSAGVPADLVASYQGVVVLSQAALWALIAGSFGWLRTRTGGEPAVDVPDSAQTA